MTKLCQHIRKYRVFVLSLSMQSWKQSTRDWKLVMWCLNLCSLTFSKFKMKFILIKCTCFLYFQILTECINAEILTYFISAKMWTSMTNSFLNSYKMFNGKEFKHVFIGHLGHSGYLLCPSSSSVGRRLVNILSSFLWTVYPILVYCIYWSKKTTFVNFTPLGPWGVRPKPSK